jgi:hypothetical protein
LPYLLLLVLLSLSKLNLLHPDIGFKPTLTRAEVRQGVTQAASQGQLVQQQHTGQDPVYAKSQRSRQEVRAEAIQSVQSRRAGDVNNLYFGG